MGRSEKKKQGRGGDPRRPRHGGAALRQRLYAKDWVVYCKPPFAGPDAVYAYLGRYTHRIGLSNRRLLHVTDERVTFATRHGKRASLAPRVFLRRFLEHVLPPGFVRIRHYGLLASAHVHAGLARARAALEPAPVSEPATGAETEPDAEADDDDEVLVETVRRLCGARPAPLSQVRPSRDAARRGPLASWAAVLSALIPSAPTGEGDLAMHRCVRPGRTRRRSPGLPSDRPRLPPHLRVPGLERRLDPRPRPRRLPHSASAAGCADAP